MLLWSFTLQTFLRQQKIIKQVELIKDIISLIFLHWLQFQWRSFLLVAALRCLEKMHVQRTCDLSLVKMELPRNFLPLWRNTEKHWSIYKKHSFCKGTQIYTKQCPTHFWKWTIIIILRRSIWDSIVQSFSSFWIQVWPFSMTDGVFGIRESRFNSEDDEEKSEVKKWP